MAAAQTQPPPLPSSHHKRHRNPASIFDLPAAYFDSARLLPCLQSSPSSLEFCDRGVEPKPAFSGGGGGGGGGDGISARLTCNTCGAEFESLLDQRSHFKSDFHRINVKLSIAGKDILKEDDFEELTSDSFIDYEISSISGSEDEENPGRREANPGLNETSKQKIFVRLQTGERVSVWKPVVLNEFDVIQYDDGKAALLEENGSSQCFKETEVIEKLTEVSREPKDNTRLRVVLLASGGHFAGCVFDGNTVVAHKTFHRYVVRAKAGRKQSLKDAGGRAAHSAGASLRRYNELALKKDIRELLASWKPYFDSCKSIFVHAPSNNRQLLFDGDKPCFSHSRSLLRHLPFIVRRPTFKEAKRVYNMLTQVAHEDDDKELLQTTEDISCSTESCPVLDKGFISNKEGLHDYGVLSEHASGIEESGFKMSETISSDKSEEEESICITTPLHEASKSGNFEKVMELLEEGLDPSIKDERGRTAYMLANEKEVRNVFRRFMALNLDKWDWNAAKVPSALTKEMEESQAAKQAEKDGKKKAKAKELKKLRKAKEKQAQASQAIALQNATKVGESSVPTFEARSKGVSIISKEEELKRGQAIEREKRAAAAERRIAAASQLNGGLSDDIKCSCCNSSLAGKVPFHRYNYKYCSSSCMHAHKQILEDG